MGKWIYKNTPYRNMVLTGTDFATGHHTLEAFKAAFEGSGGKIIKEVYPKMSTMDFAPFLAAIDVKGVDAVFGFYGGTDAVQFVKQYEEFGLKKRLPLYGHIVMADDPYLPSMGDAAIGLITVGPYTCMIDSPKNKAFVKAYNTKYGENPSRVSEFGYTAAQVIGAAAEALRGQVEDVPVVASEIMKIAPKIETPSGPLGFDQYHQRVMNMYVLKTEKRNGQLVNAVLDKLGRVPQADVWGWWNK
jgi:branched-chain amino acid transport system substrate-binding protein